MEVEVRRNDRDEWRHGCLRLVSVEQTVDDFFFCLGRTGENQTHGLCIHARRTPLGKFVQRLHLFLGDRFGRERVGRAGLAEEEILGFFAECVHGE